MALMSASVHIRSARLEDASAIAAAHVRAWRDTYRDEVPERVYAEMDREGAGRWAQRLDDPQDSATWLAVEHDSGQVAGFALAEATGPGDVRPLRLGALYVLSDWQGQGLGQALLEYAVGDAPAYLWVAEHNLRAQAFYQRNGFTLDGAREADPRWGGIVDLRMVR